MNKYAYDMSNTELLNAMTQAAANAGTSNSGIIYDPMAPTHVVQLIYLRGVVLSRLEGQLPPFRRGDEVVLKDDRPVYTKSCDGRSVGGKFLEEEGPFTVSRAWYVDDETWRLSFRKHGEHCYDGIRFQLAEVEEPVPAAS